MTVIVRILVGALTGPTTRFGASGFFCMNFVLFAKPLYVPSGISPVEGFEREVPRRFLAERASVAFSSYQLLALVASSEARMTVL